MEESVWPEQTADRSLVAGPCCHLLVPAVKELWLSSLASEGSAGKQVGLPSRAQGGTCGERRCRRLGGSLATGSSARGLSEEGLGEASVPAQGPAGMQAGVTARGRHHGTTVPPTFY